MKIRVRQDYKKLEGINTDSPWKLLFAGIIPAIIVLNAMFDELLKYDTDLTDGSQVAINPNSDYILLLFRDSENKLVTMTREYSEENQTKYFGNVGKDFEVELV